MQTSPQSPTSPSRALRRHAASLTLVLVILASATVIVGSGSALAGGVLVQDHHGRGTGGTGGGGGCGCGGWVGNSSEYEFASLPGVASIAVSPSGLFATTQETSTSNCTVVWAVTPSGNVSHYATLPLQASLCGEGSVALAPPGWGSPPVVDKTRTWSAGTMTAAVSTGEHHGRDCDCSGQQTATQDTLWDIQEGQLFEISHSGAQVALFANLSTPHASVDYGLTYDQTGNFGHDLVVTSSAGRVWTVNQTGAITLIANLHTHLEGPAVAPSSFGSYSGDLFVAGSPTGSVFAITPNGTTTNVTGWRAAESVAFATDCGCNFGNTPAVMFVANQTLGGIQAFPASYFTTLTGVGFVDGESNTGIASFTANGTTTTLATHTGHLEQLAFVVCLGSGDLSGWPGSTGHGNDGW